MEWTTTEWGGQESRSSHKEISEQAIKERAMRVFMKNEERNFLLAKHLDQLCVRPQPNEQWRIITEKSFNAYNFITSILQAGAIEDLYLAIYRINEPTVEALIQLLDNGKIRHANFIISSFFNQTKKPEQWAIRLCDYCQTHASTTKFAYLHNHAKICCIQQGGNYYVFEGSGNMSDNARIEQYVYENSKQVFDFHKGWMDELINSVK